MTAISSSSSSSAVALNPSPRKTIILRVNSSKISRDEFGRTPKGSNQMRVPHLQLRNSFPGERPSTFGICDDPRFRIIDFLLCPNSGSYLRVTLGKNFQVCHYPFSHKDFPRLTGIETHLSLKNKIIDSENASRTYSSSCLTKFSIPEEFKVTSNSGKTKEVVCELTPYRLSGKTINYFLTALLVRNSSFRILNEPNIAQTKKGSNPPLKIIQRTVSLKFPNATFKLQLKAPKAAVFTIINKNESGSSGPTEEIFFEKDLARLKNFESISQQSHQLAQQLLFRVIMGPHSETISMPSLLEMQPDAPFCRVIEDITKLTFEFKLLNDGNNCSSKVKIDFNNRLPKDVNPRELNELTPHSKTETKITTTKWSSDSDEILVQSTEETCRTTLYYKARFKILSRKKRFADILKSLKPCPQKRQSAGVSEVTDSASAADTENPTSRQRIESDGTRRLDSSHALERSSTPTSLSLDFEDSSVAMFPEAKDDAAGGNHFDEEYKFFNWDDREF